MPFREVVPLAALLLLVGCSGDDTRPSDAGRIGFDAQIDAGMDGGPVRDASGGRDAGSDAGEDAGAPDAGFDGGFDGGFDAGPRMDAAPGTCFMDSDCGMRTCMPTPGGVCDEIIPLCVAGGCTLAVVSIPFALCNRGTGRCSGSADAGMPTDAGCTTDIECGMRRCRTVGAACVEVVPSCAMGTCWTSNTSFPMATCDGPSGRCRTIGPCTNRCDCPQGLGCFGGTCIAGVVAEYCCDNPGCPTGNACTFRSGASGTCP